jgi:hypothetical protein
MILPMLPSDVFTDFPSLRVTISHGGGRCPTRSGAGTPRYRTPAWARLRTLDTCAVGIPGAVTGVLPLATDRPIAGRAVTVQRRPPPADALGARAGISSQLQSMHPGPATSSSSPTRAA